MDTRTCAGCSNALVRRYDEAHARFARRLYCGRSCACSANSKAYQERVRADRIEDLEWIAGTDTTENVARRLGYASAYSLIRTVERWDRPDLLRTLQRHTVAPLDEVAA